MLVTLAAIGSSAFTVAVIFWKGVAIFVTALAATVVICGIAMSISIYLKRKQIYDALEKFQRNLEAVELSPEDYTVTE